MLWESIVGGLLGKVAPAVADYYIQKQQLQQQYKLKKIEQKIAAREARIRRISESEGRDHEWELESIRNSGWKDEYVLILLSIPLVMVFVPTLAPFVLEGFEVLELTPDWYRWLILIIFAAVYGIRVWRRTPKA